MMPPNPARGIGTPDEVRQHLHGFAEAGVDQVCFVQQGGNNRHDHICESLELFGRAIMPEFKERAAEREARKFEELAPYLEQAMARKQKMRELEDDEVPTYVALGRQVVASSQTAEFSQDGKVADFGRGDINVPLEDPSKKAAAE
jgi:hypothetical protein